jgi:hypothetical protein
MAQMRIGVITLLMLTSPAFAEGTGQKSFAELYPPLPGVEYFCTDADGVRYELGQITCVSASCQTWTARCDMSQNNTTWRKISEGCPSVSLLTRLKSMG